MALTKDDLKAVRTIVRDETTQLVTKDDLSGAEQRLTKKVADEAESLAQMTGREFDRLHKALDVHARRVDRLEERFEKLARHVGFTFEK